MALFLEEQLATVYHVQQEHILLKINQQHVQNVILVHTLSQMPLFVLNAMQEHSITKQGSLHVSVALLEHLQLLDHHFV